MKKSVMVLFALAMSLSWSIANAGIVISRTRIIYPGNSEEVTIQLSNKSDTPLLVQTWIDDGDATANPSTTKVPFVLTPPVFRADPGDTRRLRLMKMPNDLPEDKETLFWFNTVEIPPIPEKQSGPEGGLLQMSFRTRIKLLYRPASLPVTPMQAFSLLEFHMEEKGGENTILIKNPSPYYMTISKFGLKSPEGIVSYTKLAEAIHKIVPPYGSLKVGFPELKMVLNARSRIVYALINDSGGLTQMEASLSPEKDT